MDATDADQMAPTAVDGALPDDDSRRVAEAMNLVNIEDEKVADTDAEVVAP
jgi:hypothetical protein